MALAGSMPSQSRPPTHLSSADLAALASAVAERLTPVIRSEVRRAVGAVAPDPPPQALLRIEEVARVLGCHPRTVRRIIKRGELAVVRQRGVRGQRVHPEALDAYVRDRSGTGG